jgi:hypothetical protein
MLKEEDFSEIADQKQAKKIVIHVQNTRKFLRRYRSQLYIELYLLSKYKVNELLGKEWDDFIDCYFYGLSYSSVRHYILYGELLCKAQSEGIDIACINSPSSLRNIIYKIDKEENRILVLKSVIKSCKPKKVTGKDVKLEVDKFISTHRYLQNKPSKAKKSAQPKDPMELTRSFVDDISNCCNGDSDSAKFVLHIVKRINGDPNKLSIIATLLKALHSYKKAGGDITDEVIQSLRDSLYKS